MGKILTIVIVLIVLGVGAYFLFSNGADVTGESVDDDMIDGSDVKVFVVDSSHLRFYIDGVENPDIVVNEGDRVRIEFSSSEGFHDWVVDEFGAATEKVTAGGKSSVEFVADKKGTFEYYCSVGQHRANGMKGNFIVM